MGPCTDLSVAYPQGPDLIPEIPRQLVTDCARQLEQGPCKDLFQELTR